MPFERTFHRTIFKHKLFTAVCMLFVVYILYNFNDLTVMNRFKSHLLAFGNFEQNNSSYEHQVGQVITNHNGTFKYFHLPNLDDFDIEQDFYQLDSLGKLINEKSVAAKHCLRRGSEQAVISSSQIICDCKSEYIGGECAIPSVVHRTVNDSAIMAKIARLRRPRRILMSIIWITYDYAQANQTSKRFRLNRFINAMQTMKRYIDLYIVHEIRIVTNRSLSEDRDSLEYQFRHGALAKHAHYTLLYSNISFNIDNNNFSSFDLDRIELKLMQKSWNLFVSRVTEFRPADLLIFLSINNFINDDLLLFLKYHTGLMDIVHLFPIHRFSLNPTENDNIAQSQLPLTINQSASFVLPSKQSKISLANDKLRHLQNVIFTFEFVSFLCNYKFESFISDYCLSDAVKLAHFSKNFWLTNLVTVGDQQSNLSSTFTIN